MRVAIIIVNFNSAKDIAELMPTLLASQLPKGWDRKMVMVENGSKKEDEWQALQEWRKYPEVELIKSEKNLGFTGGNNLGIKRAKELGADYLLLLNPDTVVSKDFLVNLVKPFEKETERVALASPKIYFYPGNEFYRERYKKKDQGKVIWYAGGKIDWDNVVGSHLRVDEVDNKGALRQGSGQEGQKGWEETGFCTGCCLLTTVEIMEKLGGLDDRYFFSWEDTDLSVRAQRLGFKTVYVPGSVIWHKNANTSGGAGSPVQDFYQTRNRLIFAFKYASWKVVLLLLSQILKTADWNRRKAVLSALASMMGLRV